MIVLLMMAVAAAAGILLLARRRFRQSRYADLQAPPAPSSVSYHAAGAHINVHSGPSC